MRLLGIDFGEKRIGLALAVKGSKVVTPIESLKRKSLAYDIEFLKQIVEDYEISSFVIGYALNMDGSKSKMCSSAEEFGELLKSSFNIPVYYEDERLSSLAAEERLKEMQGEYKKKKDYLDSISAVIILESYLGAV